MHRAASVHSQPSKLLLVGPVARIPPVCAGTGSVVAGMKEVQHRAFPSLPLSPLPPPTPSTRSFLPFPSTSARQAQRAFAPQLAAHSLPAPPAFRTFHFLFLPFLPSSRLDFLLAPPLPLPFSSPLPFASPTIFCALPSFSPLLFLSFLSISLSFPRRLVCNVPRPCRVRICESVRPTHAALRCPLSHLTCKPTKSHDNGKENKKKTTTKKIRSTSRSWKAQSAGDTCQSF